MKYYILRGSINIKEIGKYPQIETTYTAGDFGYNYNLGIETPVVFHKLIEPILRPKSKPTTYVKFSFGSGFMMVKKYFIDFLDEFNIAAYQYWPLKVHYRKNILNDYCLFHLSYPGEEKYVDYANSEFLIGKLGDWKDASIRKPVKIKDYENYISLLKVLYENRKDRSEIRCNKLTLNLSHAKEDIFRLYKMPYIGSGYYVSERLKNAIEEKGFTGMEFKQIENVDQRIKVTY